VEAEWDPKARRRAGPDGVGQDLVNSAQYRKVRLDRALEVCGR
jgi:hypothetical protein